MLAENTIGCLLDRRGKRRTGILGKLEAIGQVQDRFASGRWKTDISAKVPLGQVVSDLPKALNKADGKVMITME